MAASEVGFKPKIIAFLCNWCTYVGADLAGTSRIQYSPNVRIVRLMCSGAVDSVFVLKPLLDGADGVLIGGCHPGVVTTRTATTRRSDGWTHSKRFSRVWVWMRIGSGCGGSLLARWRYLRGAKNEVRRDRV
jgi:Methyl-viologen-reducing hydrogenase, delta subunit